MEVASIPLKTWLSPVNIWHRIPDNENSMHRGSDTVYAKFMPTMTSTYPEIY